MHLSLRNPRFLLPALFLALLPSLGQAATELIDFGASGRQTTVGPTGLFWNNVTEINGGNVLAPVNLIDTTSAPTGITLLVTSRFNGTNTDGTTASTLYPSSVSSDSLFGNTGTGFNGIEALNPTFTLSGLTVGVPYDFTFYASRGGVSDVRTTDYFVSGSINGTTKLNVANNINNSVSVFGITPTAAGEITISLSAAADNTNGNKFIYLGALEIQSVPEPGSAVLIAGGAALILLRKRRRSVQG